MRLYLSSFGLGNHADKLVKMMGEGKKVAVIRNALDHAEVSARQASVEKQVTSLNALGLEASEVDLREFFGKVEALRERLRNVDAVWIAGGNTFLLLHSMIESGFREVIQDLLREDKIVYAGYSAAVAAAAPTLRGIDLMDKPEAVEQIYKTAPTWEGLQLIPYSVVPHYDSDHPESSDANKAVAFFEEHHMPFKTLRDGEVIVVDGEEEALLA